MANPREYTRKLLEMVDSGILSADDVMNAALLFMSDDDVGDMMHTNQWDDTIDEESTEEYDSDGETEEDEIIIGDIVIVEGVVYVAMQGPERWDCVGCVGNHNPICCKLPDCEGLIFCSKGR